MKLIRISEPRFSTPLLTIIPPYAISGYFDIQDLVLLRQTHPSYSQKFCHISSPIINLSIYNCFNYRHILFQFPKAKLKVIFFGDPSSKLTLLSNITSLDLNYCIDYVPDFTKMPNLTSLHLDKSLYLKSDILSNMTQLLELSLGLTHKIKGSSLQKLTNLQTLILNDENTITDFDILTLPLRSLSLLRNTALTPFILTHLPLTYLNINYSLPTLTTELINCTTLTELDFRVSYHRTKDLSTISKLTWLRKLTIEAPTQIFFNWPRDLINLTYLETRYLNNILDISTSTSLQTLIIFGKSETIFPTVPLPNLSKLEINADLNVNHLKNLTHLQIKIIRLPSNRLLPELKNLKNLIIDDYYTNCSIDNYKKYCRCTEGIDISLLTSLTSLEISYCDIRLCYPIGGLISNSLESLTIVTLNPNIDDRSLNAIPNLKYLCLGNSSPREVTGSCFKNLHHLLSLTISEHNTLSSDSLDSLTKRGIKVKKY